MENASFAWDEAPFLRGVSFRLGPGELMSVVGPVGSGKSTLLAGLLGEVSTPTGVVRMGGKVVYVPQTAFIMNASLRDNIVFGRPFDQKRYKEVIEACCLQPDIDQLPAGDRTEVLHTTTFARPRPPPLQVPPSVELTKKPLRLFPPTPKKQYQIGERGINISGGQKQRVSLARAAYNDEAEIVLMDDPLSAVDAFVGEVFPLSTPLFTHTPISSYVVLT